MKEIEWAELRINDGDGGDYLNIYSDDRTYSYLLEDVFERMNEQDLARITAENIALRKLLARADVAFRCDLTQPEANDYYWRTREDIATALKQSS